MISLGADGCAAGRIGKDSPRTFQDSTRPDDRDFAGSTSHSWRLLTRWLSSWPKVWQPSSWPSARTWCRSSIVNAGPPDVGEFSSPKATKYVAADSQFAKHAAAGRSGRAGEVIEAERDNRPLAANVDGPSTEPRRRPLAVSARESLDDVHATWISSRREMIFTTPFSGIGLSRRNTRLTTPSLLASQLKSHVVEHAALRGIAFGLAIVSPQLRVSRSADTRATDATGTRAQLAYSECGS